MLSLLLIAMAATPVFAPDVATSLIGRDFYVLDGYTGGRDPKFPAPADPAPAALWRLYSRTDGSWTFDRVMDYNEREIRSMQLSPDRKCLIVSGKFDRDGETVDGILVHTAANPLEPVNLTETMLLELFDPVNFIRKGHDYLLGVLKYQRNDLERMVRARNDDEREAIRRQLSPVPLLFDPAVSREVPASFDDWRYVYSHLVVETKPVPRFIARALEHVPLDFSLPNDLPPDVRNLTIAANDADILVLKNQDDVDELFILNKSNGVWRGHEIVADEHGSTIIDQHLLYPYNDAHFSPSTVHVQDLKTGHEFVLNFENAKAPANVLLIEKTFILATNHNVFYWIPRGDTGDPLPASNWTVVYKGDEVWRFRAILISPRK